MSRSDAVDSNVADRLVPAGAAVITAFDAEVLVELPAAKDPDARICIIRTVVDRLVDGVVIDIDAEVANADTDIKAGIIGCHGRCGNERERRCDRQ
jgi:hypothetical protein